MFAAAAIRRHFLCGATAALVATSAITGRAAPLLPDLIAWANQPKNYMYGGSLSTTLIKNKVVYRFVGALPNVGAGRLEVREFTHPDATQDVYQRIYDSEGGVTET